MGFRRNGRCCALLARAVFGVGCVSSAATAQTASWVAAVSGSWTDASRWSSNPLFPNDPVVQATIGAIGAIYEVDLSGGESIGVGQLLLNAPSLTFNQNNASLRVANGGTAALHAGTYNLGGTATLDVGASMFSIASLSSTARFTTDGLSRVSAGTIEIGVQPNGFVSGPTSVRLAGSSTVSIGRVLRLGNAQVVQEGSAAVIADEQLAIQRAATYTLNGGMLTSASPSIGGTFIQNGGVFRTALAPNGSSSAVSISTAGGGGQGYIMNGGTLIADTMILNAGTFQQNGGYVDLHGNPLFFSTGKYELNGGTLDSNLTSVALGVFQQTGGVHAVSTLHIGRRNLPEDSNVGSYTISGGIINAESIFVGDAANNQFGSGSMYFSGGTINVTAGLNVYRGDSFAMTGGVLNADAVNVAPDGNLTIGGGTVTTNGMNIGGGTTAILGGAASGALTVGGAGLNFSGDQNPTLLLTSDSTGNVAKLTLNGNVRSIISTGIAGIASTPVGVGQPQPVLDLGGAVRTFQIDDGDNSTDFVIGLPTVNGGILKTGGGLMSINSAFTGAGGIQVNAGTLQLRASNSFTGNVSLTGGTLRITADTQLGDGANQIQLAGGTLQVDGSVVTTRSILIGSAGGTVSVAEGKTFFDNQPSASNITGTGALVKSGAGLWQVNSSNSFAGPIAVNQGTLLIGGFGSFLHAPQVSIGPAGRLALFGGSPPKLGQNTDIVLDGGDVYLGPDTVGKLHIRSGGSYVAFKNPFTTSGTGTATFSGGIVRSEAATVDFEVQTGRSLQIAAQSSGFIGAWAVARGASGVEYAKYDSQLGVLPFDAIDYSTTLTAGAHVKGVNTTITTGSTTVRTLNRSTVFIPDGTVLTLSDGGLLNSFLYNPNFSPVAAGTLRSSTGEIDVFGDGAIWSRIDDSGTLSTALVKSGEGNLQIGGHGADGQSDLNANTYTGTTWVHRGQLQLNKAPGVNAIPGNLVIDGGAVVLFQDDQISDASNVLLTAGTLNLNGHNDTVFNLKNNGGTLITGSGTLTVLSPSTMSLLGGTSTISVNSTVLAKGVLLTGGNNTIQRGGNLNIGTGGFVMQQGESANPTLFISPDEFVPGKITLAAGANISFLGTIGTANLGGNETAGLLDLSGTTHTVTVNNGTADVDMLITARIVNGALIKSGSGTLRLVGSNSFGGGLTVTNGTVEVTSNAALGTGPLVLNGGNLALVSDSFETNLTTDLTAGTAAVTLARATPGTPGTFRFQYLRPKPGGRISVAGTGKLFFQFGIVLTGDVVLDDNVTITASRLLGTNDFTKVGGATFTLGQSIGQTFEGTTIVSDGKMILRNNFQNPNSHAAAIGTLIINGGGAVRYEWRNQILDNAPVTLNAASGNVVLDTNGFADAIGSLTFTAGGSIIGNGTLTLLGDVTSSGLVGSAQVAANLVLPSARIFNIANTFAADDLLVSGAVTGSGSLIKSGAGLMRVTGSVALSGGVVINAGSLILSGGSNVGTLTNAAGISIAPNSAVKVASLNNTGSIDIAGALIIDYVNSSPFSALAAQLQTGYANGLWNGPGINTSGANDRAALGFAEASAISIRSLFGASFDNSAVVIRYTMYGDSDLDGLVTIADFNRLAVHFNQTSAIWSDGDFNYDGIVNALDFNALASNFGQTLASPALGNLVPEPSAVLIPGILALTARRQRQR